MTTVLSKAEKKDIYKSHIYQLCNFLRDERKPPKSVSISRPIEINLKRFAELSEYIDEETKELKIEKLKNSLIQLSEDFIVEGQPPTIITINNPEILEDFQNSYTEDKKIVIRCSAERLRAYKEKLIELAKSDKKEVVQKYPEINETIKLKTLGIKIEEKEISRGIIKKGINPTDRAIIYYLYCRFIEDAEQCIKLEIFATKIKKEERNIQNRITKINNMIREFVLNGKNGWLSKNDFIKYENERGYHLNPRLLIQFRKGK